MSSSSSEGVDNTASDYNSTEALSTGGSSDEALKEHEATTAHHDHDLPILQSQRKGRRKSKQTTYQEKWNYCQQFYSDNYRQLLKDESDLVPQQQDIAEGDNLESSQVGSVSWTPAEKQSFFNTLARKGRLDISSISAALGSKSVVEVQAYLRLIQDSLNDKFLFSPKEARIGLEEIPTANEIDCEAEHMLEKAADALCMYQEQYENAAGEKVHGNRWLINYEDARKDEDGRDASPSSNIDEDPESFPARDLFQLPNFFELSENVFMNRSTPASDQNWRKLAVSGERPAATFDFLAELHNIVLSVSRRLIQTSLFVAQTRLRASRYEMYAPAKLVKHQDVVAAVDVLKMKRDSFAFWQKAPRRCGLQVVKVRHGRGFNKHPLSYEDVETALSKRSKKRRGRRQSSTESEDYTSSEETSAETSTEGSTTDQDSEDGDATRSKSASEHDADGLSTPSFPPFRSTLPSRREETHKARVSSDDTDSDHTDATESDSSFESRQHARANTVDLIASRAENLRLLRLLQDDSSPVPDTDTHNTTPPPPPPPCPIPQSPPPPQRPDHQHTYQYPPIVPTTPSQAQTKRTLTKFKDWKDTFLPRAEWEENGELLPPERFLRTEEERWSRRRKREEGHEDERSRSRGRKSRRRTEREESQGANYDDDDDDVGEQQEQEETGMSVSKDDAEMEMEVEAEVEAESGGEGEGEA